MRRLLIAAGGLAVLGAALVGADAKMLIGGSRHGGFHDTPIGCSTVCATSQNGQTFITWTDQATGATGDTWRYKIYESTSPQNSGNCASGTLTATWVPNNSAQLMGGNPDTSGGVTYTQTHRQDASQEMMALSLAGSPLATYTGLWARTIPTNRTAYYCVIAFDNTFNSGGHSDTYLGTTGAVPEVVAAPQPIERRVGTNRTADPSHTLNPTGSPAGIAVEWDLHASQSTGGSCSNDSPYGDFWVFFGDKTMAYQDGLPTVMCVVQLHSRSPNVLNVFYRETRWTTNYENPYGIEWLHLWTGSIPSAETQAAYGANSSPHMYQFDVARLKWMWDWTKANYNVGTNNWVLFGQSQGGWGTAEIGTRWYPSYFAMCNPSLGRWRYYDDAASSGWPTINSTTPFGANIGTNASAITFPDGTVWGGTGGWTDLPTYIASATVDLCPMLMVNSKNDSFAKWANAVDAANAFQSGHQFYALAWNSDIHTSAPPPNHTLWKQFSAFSGGALNLAYAYDEAWFKTNVALPVFSNSSFNDDLSADAVGCHECGWQWTSTADTASHISFTYQNNWMALSPGTAGSGASLRPTGPQHGPFSTATTDLTLGRRAQNFNPSGGTGVTCTNTPFGGSPAVQSLTANAQGDVTFIGAVVNTGGSNTIDCTVP